MTFVPTDCWNLIAKNIRPNPVVYIQLSKLCRSSYQTFSSNYLWYKLWPIESEDAYTAFSDYVGSLPEIKQELLFDCWEDEVRMSIGEQLIAGEYEYDSFIDIDQLRGPVALAWVCCKARLCGGNCLQFPEFYGFYDKYFTMTAVRLFSCLILSAPQFWHDKDVVRAAIEGDEHFPFTRVPVEDRELCALLLQKHPAYVAWAPSDLQTPANFLRALEEDPREHMADPDGIRRNRLLLIEVVSRDGMMLKHADPVLQRDDDVVMAAVTNNGYALKFALVKTYAIVHTAVTAGGGTSVSALGEFVNNEEIVRLLVATDPESVNWLPPDVRQRLRTEAFEHGPVAFEHGPN